LGGLLDIRRLNYDVPNRPQKNTRSLSLGGDEKEQNKKPKKRHNSPDDLNLKKVKMFDPSIEIGPFEVTRYQEPGPKKTNMEPLISKLEKHQREEMKREENEDEEMKIPEDLKVEPDKQSTDEEDKDKDKPVVEGQDGNINPPNSIDHPQDDTKEDADKDAHMSKEEGKASDIPPVVEEAKKEVEELPPKEKEIKEELKEESLEMLWRLCQEYTVSQGLDFPVHKGSIDAFAIALAYNPSEVKWKYISKIMDKLQQNESVISICSVLKKFLQQIPEGDIAKIRERAEEEPVNELEFPKTRIELISRLDKDFALMNELMSLNIEFKRKTLDMIYDHLGRNVDREQSLETQSSLSSDNDAEGEDTEEEEDVQTDAASRPSQQLSNNGNEDNEENDDTDIDMKSGQKPQALSEDDGFIMPKKREARNKYMSSRNSNNGEEEIKDNKRANNQSLSITDMSMTDEDNKEKDLDQKLMSKRSHSVSNRDPTQNSVIPESPVLNHRENDFLHNVETNSVYEMMYFKEVNERLDFIKFILKNSDEAIKPIHIKILWECHIDSSFHEKETSIFLDWCTSIIKIQAGYVNTRREGLTIFDDDTVELIFFESLLCLDFPSISQHAYDCFEEYFTYINVQFGQLIKNNYGGSYEVFETKLIGIQALWEIVLQAKVESVHVKASKFLLTLYKKLSPDLIENLNQIKEEFLKICMSHIKDGVK